MSDASTIDRMLDAADPAADSRSRLTALRGLAETVCRRPIPAPRWRVLSRRIEAELRRRAEVESRPAAEVFESEVEAALVLAAPAAERAAAAAYVATLVAELQRLVGDLVLEALLGDWRHHAEDLTAVQDRADAGADPLEAAHAEHLLARLPALADLTASELTALSAELTNDATGSGHRMALSRGREKARRVVPKADR